MARAAVLIRWRRIGSRTCRRVTGSCHVAGQRACGRNTTHGPRQRRAADPQRRPCKVGQDSELQVPRLLAGPWAPILYRTPVARPSERCCSRGRVLRLGGPRRASETRRLRDLMCSSRGSPRPIAAAVAATRWTPAPGARVGFNSKGGRRPNRLPTLALATREEVANLFDMRPGVAAGN
jgi:hypothetical protein